MRNGTIRKVVLGAIAVMLLGISLWTVTGCCDAPSGDANTTPAGGTGTITVNAYVDGNVLTAPANVAFTLTSAQQTFSDTSLPKTYATAPVDTYILTYNGGVPANTTFVNITPTTQTLTAFGNISFRINFKTQQSDTGSIVVKATLDNAPWTGPVGFTITGPQTISGALVDFTSNGQPGTYGVTYTGGGPSTASFLGVTPSAPQALSSGGSITFTLPFKTKDVTTGSITVKATLDGAPWTGSVGFTITGPQTISGALVDFTSAGLPGTYGVTYTGGGPSGSFLGVAPSTPQALTSGSSITFTLPFKTKEASTGTVNVAATLDGVPWTGTVGFALTGPQTITGTLVNFTSAGLPGAYGIAYTGGGPSGASFLNVTPSAPQTLTAGGSITYTLQFKTKEASTGTVNIGATLDGAPWTGTLGFTMNGPMTFAVLSTMTYNSMPPGTYSVANVTNGPPNTTYVSTTPAASQVLTAGGNITFTLNYTSKKVETGTIVVNATVAGAAGSSPWTGPISFTLTGPQTFTGTSVSQTFSGVPIGTYTLRYVSGGPPSAKFSSITVSETQTLISGGTMTFTFNFR